jgi:hypothetical protein
MSAVHLAARSAAFAALVLFAPSLRANTYTVDAGGGGQFTDIPPAIAFAQPGDVLLVQAGSYSAFTLDKGLVIIGYGNVLVGGTAQIVNVAVGQRAALVHVKPSDVTVEGCAGAVVLQDMHNVNTVAVQQSNDVRISDVHAEGYPPMGLDGLALDTARLELVDSVLWGEQGLNGGSPGYPQYGQNGGRGISAGPSTRVHIARSNIFGGLGGDAYTALHYGGDGGAAMSLATPCEVFVVGPGTLIQGGLGGYAYYNQGFECWADGAGACGVVGSGDVHDSGTMIVGAYTNQSFHCGAGGGNQPAFCGPSEFPVVPADPSLQLTGIIPTAGAPITFILYGEPGASAVLNLGRNMILVPTPGIDIERLAPANRVIPLGTIPASGSITRNLTLPASFTPGLLFVAQAEVTGSNGLRRTNSTPIVVR